MDSVLRALSPAMRLCSAVLTLASSVGTVGVELLQPEKVKASESAVTVARMRGAERMRLTDMEPLFLRRAWSLLKTL
jgi:hypothetical protein